MDRQDGQEVSLLPFFSKKGIVWWGVVRALLLTDVSGESFVCLTAFGSQGGGWGFSRNGPTGPDGASHYGCKGPQT